MAFKKKDQIAKGKDQSRVVQAGKDVLQVGGNSSGDVVHGDKYNINLPEMKEGIKCIIKKTGDELHINQEAVRLSEQIVDNTCSHTDTSAVTMFAVPTILSEATQGKVDEKGILGRFAGILDKYRFDNQEKWICRHCGNENIGLDCLKCGKRNDVYVRNKDNE